MSNVQGIASRVLAQGLNQRNEEQRTEALNSDKIMRQASQFGKLGTSIGQAAAPIVAEVNEAAYDDEKKFLIGQAGRMGDIHAKKSLAKLTKIRELQEAGAPAEEVNQLIADARRTAPSKRLLREMISRGDQSALLAGKRASKDGDSDLDKALKVQKLQTGAEELTQLKNVPLGDAKEAISKDLKTWFTANKPDMNPESNPKFNLLSNLINNSKDKKTVKNVSALRNTALGLNSTVEDVLSPMESTLAKFDVGESDKIEALSSAMQYLSVLSPAGRENAMANLIAKGAVNNMGDSEFDSDNAMLTAVDGYSRAIAKGINGTIGDDEQHEISDALSVKLKKFFAKFGIEGKEVDDWWENNTPEEIIENYQSRIHGGMASVNSPLHKKMFTRLFFVKNSTPKKRDAFIKSIENDLVDSDSDIVRRLGFYYSYGPNAVISPKTFHRFRNGTNKQREELRRSVVDLYRKQFNQVTRDHLKAGRKIK